MQQHYTPIDKFDYYKKMNKKYFSGAEKYFSTTLSLPIFYNLNEKSLKRVFNEIKLFTLNNEK